ATVTQLVNVVTVRGVAEGAANITVTSEDGSKTAKCVVTVTAA
ncbi:Ig-like domain-containing protein, partial [Salmonella enterica]|nr:Ig-like domain-containing protein [Salmonella enterica]